MPTDNPKISAYVPQILFDRFKQYQEESKLSMSQAIIALLATHFGIQQTIKESSLGTVVGGVTPGRIENIEKSLFELKEEVEKLKSTGSLSYSEHNTLKTGEIQEDKISDVNQGSEFERVQTELVTYNPLTNDELPSDLLIDFDFQEAENSLPNEPVNEPLNSNHNLELQLFPPGKLLQVDSKLLAKRFELKNFRSVNNVANKNENEFVIWSEKKDPDGISWRKNKISRGQVKFSPVDSTPKELLSELQNWLTENS